MDTPVIGICALALASRVTLPAVMWILVGAALSQAVGLTLLFIRLRNAPDAPPGKAPTLRKLLLFSLPALILALAQAWVLRVDRLLLGIFVDTTAVGIYGVASTLAEASCLVAVALSNMVFRAASQGRVNDIKRLRRNILALTALSAGVIAVGAQFLTVPLLGPAYRGAIEVTHLFALTSISMASSRVDIAVLTGCGRFSDAAKVATLGAVTLLVTSLAL